MSEEVKAVVELPADFYQTETRRASTVRLARR